MANRSKAKGTAFETAVVDWLSAQGFGAFRLPLYGNKDRGDVDTGAGWHLECKNVRTLALAQWVAEADIEAVNARKPVAVVVKRVGRSDPGESYVVMPLRVFAQSVLSDQSVTLSQ